MAQASASRRVRAFGSNQSATLYLHYPCFDGLISGVLSWEFLENNEGWKIEQVHPVNYNLRESWLTTKLETPCAVADFLYHPRATFWADHHMTSFLTQRVSQNFKRRRRQARLFYDPKAGSCATLLWKRLGSDLGGQERYREMVAWAERIDSATYSSVGEAILGDAPALRINFSLMVRSDERYCEYLLTHLRRETLGQVAELPEVLDRYKEQRSKTEAGLQRLRNLIRLEPDGIAVFEAEATEDAILNRYAPYHFFPEAKYSIGLVRSKRGASITAMRNPWWEFRSIQLGKIFEEYGGGGHQRVGSVFLANEDSAAGRERLNELLREMRAAMATTAQHRV